MSSVRNFLRVALTRVARGPLATRAIVAGALLLHPQLGQAQGGVVMSAATAIYDTPGGVTDTVTSNTVQTTIVRPQASLTKSVIGARSARVGDSVQYRLAYANASATVPVTNAVLIDSLPAGLEYAGAQPSAVVSGREVRWALGDLAPGSSGFVNLTVLVAGGIQDTLRVRNVAQLTSVNTTDMVALSEVVALIGPSSRALALTQTAEVLEVGLGETAPFTVVVQNPGTVPLTGIVVRSTLPEGGRYLPRSVSGTDSVRVSGRTIEFFVPGTLRPGATLTVHFSLAVVSASTSSIATLSHVTAEGSDVRSADVATNVRVRRGFSMENRAVIGKVWVDQNDNGTQDEGERGMDGVEIWTDDGEIATTDSAGRYSFRNIRPGHHAFRLDPASLPAGFLVATTRSTTDLVTRDASGWTTPTVNFRVQERSGRLASVLVPLGWSVVTHRDVERATPSSPDSASLAVSAGGRDSAGVAARNGGRVGPNAGADTVPVAAADPVLSILRALDDDLVLPRFSARDVAFPFASSRLSAASMRVLSEVADSLRAHPGTRVVIGGHTDAVGSRRYNLRLSLKRAAVVRRVLVGAGIPASRLLLRGYGPDRPVALNRTATGRARNRRWDIRPVRSLVSISPRPVTGPVNGRVSPTGADTVRGPVPGAVPKTAPRTVAPNRSRQLGVRYETSMRNRYSVELDGLSIRFPQPLDSMVVFSGDSIIARGSGTSLTLPSIPANTELRIVGWGLRSGDSAGVTLERDGRVLDQLVRPSADSVSIQRRTVGPVFRVDSLPEPTSVPAGGEVEITVAPPQGGWPGSGTFPLPTGWELVPGAAPDTLAPKVVRDRSGSRVLLWQFGTASQTPTVVRLRPVVDDRPAEVARVPSLRSAEERAAERRREFLDGPTVRFTDPGDGQVMARDRIFVGVKGESGAAVSLFDGDSLLEKTTLRIDGAHDFIAVALAPGPHRLRVSMQNSANRERWDSVAVHVTGAPEKFVPEHARTTFTADGQSIESLRVRVLDRWGVPVTNQPEITVAASGVQPLNPDASSSSVGIQVVPDTAGWLTLRLQAGSVVMRGAVELSWARMSQEVAVDVLPANKPLLLVGVGRIGVGSSAEAFGAITARGRIDRKTSIVASFDSRRLDGGINAFGRTADPLDASQYPILGDASAQRTSGTSRYRLAARVERGFDWLALGDVSTAGFASGLQLTSYRRALPGVATRIMKGGIEWQGFGSSTTQRLRQLQARGAGISGPYQLARNIRDGTEQVALETRAAENATRVLSRQVLTRFVDYQIDYIAGTLLFKQPVPAIDGYGNPVFVVVLYESESGGPRSAVWGVRGALDANQWLRSRAMDSVRLGATMVQEGREAGGHRLLGADVRLLKTRGVELTGETAWSRSGDSSGVAATVNGSVTMFGGAARLTGAWMTVGREFGNPASGAIQGGTREYRFGGEVRQGSRLLTMAHEWQQFGLLGLDRRHSTAAITESVGKAVELKATMTGDRFTGISSPTGSLGGELRVQWKPQQLWTLFTEGRRQFSVEGANLQPDFIGVGASLAMYRNVALDMRHRMVFLRGDSGSYSVTEMGVRTRLGAGSEAFGKYQIAGIDGGRNAALVGLRNRIALGESWTLNALMERRQGIGRASVFDPVRALPFLQVEEDYWSVGLGSEFVRPGSPLRMSARGEMRNGDIRSTRLLTVAGDASISRSLAVLSRQEILGTEQSTTGLRTRSHRYSSAWGVAFRPVQSNVLNILGKVDWIDVASGDGGGSVLTGPTGETRAIFAGEAIWRPLPRSEIAGRYAVRSASGSLVASDRTTLPIRSTAEFIGWRASRQLRPYLELRANGRLLIERQSGSRRLDLAPEFAFMPQPALEIVSGYRLGNLRDPDFAVDGGRGWFLTFGARLTEGTVNSAADFWRQRMGGR